MQDDERAIRERIVFWMKATAAGDTERVLGLVAEDVLFLMAGQPPIQGKAAFAANQAALVKFRVEPTAEVQEIRVFGEWAWTRTSLSVVVTPLEGGLPVKRAGSALSIWKKQPDGTWVLFRDANLVT